MSLGDVVEYRCKLCGLDNLPGPRCPDCKTEVGIEDRFRPDPDTRTRPAQQMRVFTVEELKDITKLNPEGIFSKSALIRIRLRQILEKPGTAVPVRMIAKEFADAKLFEDYRRASVRVRNVAERAGYQLRTEANCTFIIRPKDMKVKKL